jgi:hypothetical protein
MNEMSIDEMREESRRVYAEVERLRRDTFSEEGAEEIAALSQRWQALDAEVHRRMMEDTSLAGAIYRANGGYFPTAKTTI